MLQVDSKSLYQLWTRSFSGVLEDVYLHMYSRTLLHVIEYIYVYIKKLVYLESVISRFLSKKRPNWVCPWN